MMLCDSNAWLALALSKHGHHATAREWLDTVEEPATVFLCRATQQTFLRLLTNASVQTDPRSADQCRQTAVRFAHTGTGVHPSSGTARAWRLYASLERSFRKGGRVNFRSAFEVLEPCAGNSQARFLEGLGGRKAPPGLLGRACRTDRS
jgi:hypothetical protein